MSNQKEVKQKPKKKDAARSLKEIHSNKAEKRDNETSGGLTRISLSSGTKKKE